MNHKAICEICGQFRDVGFSDCGMICESCFQKEVLHNAFNAGLNTAIKTILENTDPTETVETANLIEKIKGKLKMRSCVFIYEPKRSRK